MTRRRSECQGYQAARGTGAEGGDDLGYSAVRRETRFGTLRDLLKTFESGWKPAKSLIVVTNGALGLLPLSLLPTAPAEIKTDDDPLFASYRNVPWLARTHAVTMVPSASAMQTLRKLPPGKSTRQDLIAFGDPYFSKEQADDAAKSDKLFNWPMLLATHARHAAQAPQQPSARRRR